MSNKNINGLLNFASKKLNTNPNQLKNMMQSGNITDAVKNMDGVDKDKFNKLMNNPKEMEKLLNSPQAKMIISKLMEGNK